MPHAVLATDPDAPENWLHPTRYIDSSHAAIKGLARRLVGHIHGDRPRALALFAHVRDDVKFGFASGFWDRRASAVARGGIGFCNNKSTLFVALLRASGIPARQVFMEIDARILSGLLDPGTPYLDHSCTEVFLDGRWVLTDAYTVDKAMFEPARAQLSATGQRLGLGVHGGGTVDWDGRLPAFSQFNHIHDPKVRGRIWGVYEDVGQFYAQAPRSWNRLNPVLRLSMGLLAASANDTADKLRQKVV